MSTDPQRPDDRELEDFMAGKGPVSREYARLDQPSAPPQLDDAVLRMAREALRVKPKPAPRWRVPLALAATLLLGLSTTLLVREQRGALTPAPTAQQDLLPMPQAEEEPAAQTRAAARAMESAGAAAQEKRKRDQAAPAKPRPSVGGSVASGALKKEEQAMPAAPAESMPAPAAVPQQPLQDAPAPPPPAPKAMRQAPAPAAALMAEPERRAYREDSLREKDQAAPDDRADPDAWLARVRALLAQKQPDEARRQLKAWVAAYPERAVPDDLKALLN